MAVKKGGLGRGLDSLFADTTGTTGAAPVMLALNEIERDENQPRKNFESEPLAELAASITEHGVLQPIVVRQGEGQGYYIIAGERRFRAARMAGLTEIPAIIKDVTLQKAAEIALVENLQREDLNPVEEAFGYRRLMQENNLTQEQAAVKVGKSRAAVANAIRLLNLCSEALEALEKGAISEGHAKVLLGVEDGALQAKMTRQIIKEALNVRSTERLVRGIKKSSGGSPDSIRPVLPAEVELALQNILGTKVHVQYKNGKGFLSIPFYSDEELKDLANMLGKTKQDIEGE